ncbi:MAG TPA: sugar transferase [Gemmatimonadaceae bacterium]|nr:sugar transferase [Gemmatimonadaceae bacterium]
MDAALSTPITEHARREATPRGSHSAAATARGAALGDVERSITLVTSADVGYAEPRAVATEVSALGQFMPRERSEIAARALNVIVAGVAILLLLPVFVAIALLIKLTSKGPVFYTQTRVGLDRRGRRPASPDADQRARDLGGRPFTIYKFRSMRVDAEAGRQAVWATPDDDRITKVGRVLRKTRLDELPQLFNVLVGDMNIVGPRPERPSIFAQLREEIDEYPLRQLAKPGITGWAQINQAYDSCVEDVRRKVQYDIEYLARQSLAEDLAIMVKTIPVMLFRRGGW